jgi:hypothetical protein
MKIAPILICLTFLAGQPCRAANLSNAQAEQSCQNPLLSSAKSLLEFVSLKNNRYKLTYDHKSRKLMLFFDRKGISLQQFSKGRDPALVGADKVMGFLPDKLQVYKRSNVLLYVSSIRTNAGEGGGQCGAGSEIYLNFLSVKKQAPKVSSRILIGSCDYSIELDNQSIPDGEVGEISVQEGKLFLHFLNYKDLSASPVATISPNQKELMFRK